MAVDEHKGFLSRWSRRKAEARQGEQPTDVTAPVVVRPVDNTPEHVEGTGGRDASTPKTVDAARPEATRAPLPTMDDVALLTRESDYARFVAPEVSGEVRNAALKKLFTDPHFNVMDGLDTYIDDYNTPTPLPQSVLRQMAQAAFLGLVDKEPAPTPAPMAGNAPAETKTHDEDPDLRLQPLDDAGPPGPEPGIGEDAGRQH